jgi:sigma-B regulation protein RsbU (phosphoserine phosphatase)
MRILVAEDERITRRSLQRELERWGHEVVAVEDGAEAWEQFQSQQFDIVVTDWEMPHVDGRELIERIRTSDETGYAYLIMLTGRSEKSDLVTGMESGADDFLAKPFDRDELRVRVRAGERIIRLERRLATQNDMLQAANARMHHDLEAAARVQQSLLPSTPPKLKGAEFAWRYDPCDELAGDLLNVMPIDDQRVALYVADVSGHGVASSLLSVSVHRSLSLRSDQASLILTPGANGEIGVAPPASVAEQLNGIYPMESNGGHFLTLIYGWIDLTDRRLKYCCAGHSGPILIRPGESSQSFDSSSFPLGIVAGAEYEGASLDLRAGDRVYFYSDGLIEASDESNELFGRVRLESVLEEAHGLPLRESIDAAVQAAAAWQKGGSFDDDISMLAVQINDE